MVWRREVPLEMLEAALHWLPVIEAEQNFRWSDIGAVGAGNFKNRSGMNRVIRPWQRAIRRGRPREKVKPTKAGFVSGLAQLGIGYVELGSHGE